MLKGLPCQFQNTLSFLCRTKNGRVMGYEAGISSKGPLRGRFPKYGNSDKPGSHIDKDAQRHMPDHHAGRRDSGAGPLGGVRAHSILPPGPKTAPRGPNPALAQTWSKTGPGPMLHHTKTQGASLSHFGAVAFQSLAKIRKQGWTPFQTSANWPDQYAGHILVYTKKLIRAKWLEWSFWIPFRLRFAPPE